MTKDELRSHRKAVREVRQLREQLRTLETAMLDPRAPNLAAAPMGSGPSNPVERAILRAEALRGRYADKLAALLAQQERIEQSRASTPVSAWSSGSTISRVGRGSAYARRCTIQRDIHTAFMAGRFKNYKMSVNVSFRSAIMVLEISAR